MDSENTHNNLFLSKQAHRKPHALFCYFYNVKDCKDKFYYRIHVYYSFLKSGFLKWISQKSNTHKIGTSSFFLLFFFLLNPLINYQIASQYSFLQLNQQSSRVLLIYWSEVFCSWPCDSSIPPLDRIVPINYP